MIVTLFSNTTDNAANRQFEKDWPSVVAWLSSIEPLELEDKLDSPAAVFGRWKATTDPTAVKRQDGKLRRCQENFIELHAFTLDIEQRPGQPAIRLSDVLDALDGLTYFAFTTYSHELPGKGERYRVVLPLAVPLPTSELDNLARLVDGQWVGALPELFPFCDHKPTWKRLQIAYLPAAPDTSTYACWSQEGQLFDWRMLDILPARPIYEITTSTELSKDNNGPADLRTLDLYDWFDDHNAIKGAAVKGQERVMVTCPNRLEHTDEADNGSALLLERATGSYGFNCFHSSCGDLNGHNMKRFIKENDPSWASYCLRSNALTIEQLIQRIKDKKHERKHAREAVGE